MVRLLLFCDIDGREEMMIKIWSLSKSKLKSEVGLRQEGDISSQLSPLQVSKHPWYDRSARSLPKTFKSFFLRLAGGEWDLPHVCFDSIMSTQIKTGVLTFTGRALPQCWTETAFFISFFLQSWVYIVMINIISSRYSIVIRSHSNLLKTIAPELMGYELLNLLF